MRPPFPTQWRGSNCSKMKFYVHRLGCPKNDVDADYICARLQDEGHEPVERPEEAESIIVNTCGFILLAKEESIEEILRLAQLKSGGRLKSLYVSGCLSQRYGDELLNGMPEIDGAFGIGELDAIAAAMTSAEGAARTIRTPARRLTYVDYERRVVSDRLPYAYLKISDGCNRGCTYCVIPGIRGPFRSRPLETVVREARRLAQSGRKELILVSQDATLYGCDLRPSGSLIKLLMALYEIDEVAWIRVMYLHPAQVNGELIDYMASANKTLTYFDLPLQHINTDLLRAMGRGTDRRKIENLLRSIRARCDGAILRTTFIVGFPGETTRQFTELCDFVDEQRFDRVGVFTYSVEEGTPAAEMVRQVREETKTRRLDRLMSLQREIAFAKNVSLIGAVREVIIDSVSADGIALGRTRGDCPQIDQEVRVRAFTGTTGDIRRIRIDAANGYDLEGTCGEE